MGRRGPAMALHQIYANQWGRTIDSTVMADRESGQAAERGEEMVTREREARCGWRLSWQSCDVRAAKCAPAPARATAPLPPVERWSTACAIVPE